ncbi:DNA-binding response regulator [Kitasatospora herbaricolor]|uniref:LuxR C-terminal-related transcriptional regulator n=1 Tax=Kitasatospora herbaricolor TaxID=68217 RepID=UPI00174DB5C8|nr:response regulator transcription factor [Kitasatospora herbaricolor]MDQ0306615.1 DNA-binding NarL/FixJ family response regulator [Kitasatospora herbaricolor]GGV33972.1 DNA-binding response regulator [Kitasatospora herbaricolor]
MSTEVRRVAVVGDCPLFRRGLAQVIESTGDLALVPAAGSVEEVEGRLQPGDVVLVDLQLRPADLSAAVFRLAGRGAEVLVLCSPLQQDIVPPMEAGARGCLSRQAGEPELLAAIRLVASGCGYVSAALAVRRWSEPPCRVTDRERQILELVANGETDHGIAERLGISEHTVHSHLDRLRDKIGSRRRADLTRFAVAHDIVPNA